MPSNRREFITRAIGTAAGAAGALAAPGRVLGANDRVRFALIGAGARGKEIFHAALKAPNTEAVAVADVYTRRLDEARAIVPGIQAHRDFRRVLDDKSIDAVLIATPQHQHVLTFVPAIQAGKDVYQEKTMAFNPGHAKRMRAAFQNSGRVVQIGMQMNSGDGIVKAKEWAGRLGKITLIQANHFRNAPYGGWLRQIPADCDTEHIDWAGFQGEAAPHPFDPQRYMNWRFFWDYSGGNVFENMVHQVGFWFEALHLGIPESVTMTGANYLSPKMQLPDVMNVSMSMPEKITFVWGSTFYNDYFGEGQDFVFGTEGTLIHKETDDVVFQPQKEKQAATSSGPNAEYRDYTERHMRNFFDCVRSRKEPTTPFEIGFRAAIACQMSCASYRRQATVRWDPGTEEIV